MVTEGGKIILRKSGFYVPLRNRDTESRSLRMEALLAKLLKGS